MFSPEGSKFVHVRETRRRENENYHQKADELVFNYNYFNGGGFGNDVPLMEPAFGAPGEWDGSGGSSSLQTSDILYESSWLTLSARLAFVASISKSILEQSWSQNLEACAMVEESATKEIRNSTILVIPIIREAFAHQTFRSYQSPAFKPGLPMKHTIQLSSGYPWCFQRYEILELLDFYPEYKQDELVLVLYGERTHGQSLRKSLLLWRSKLNLTPRGTISRVVLLTKTKQIIITFMGHLLKSVVYKCECSAGEECSIQRFREKDIGSSEGGDMSTELVAVVPYLSVYFSRDTSSAKAPVESVVINAQCTSAETCEFTLASSKSNDAFAYAVVGAEGLGRGVLESGTFSLSSTENEKTVAMTYSNIASASSAHVSVAIWSASGSVYSETYLAGTTSRCFPGPEQAFPWSAKPKSHFRTTLR